MLCCAVKCNVLVCFVLYEYMHVRMCAFVCMLTIKRIAFNCPMHESRDVHAHHSSSFFSL